MKIKLSLFFLFIVLMVRDAEAYAAEFSTSILKPIPLGPEGTIASTFPSVNGKTTYYFSADLQKGDLLTHLFFKGQNGREKRVEFALLDSNAHLDSAYWIQGSEAQRDATRSFTIDKGGQRLFWIVIFGPETDEFRLEFGGSAFPPASPQSPAALGETGTTQQFPVIELERLRGHRQEPVESTGRQCPRQRSDRSKSPCAIDLSRTLGGGRQTGFDPQPGGGARGCSHKRFLT